LGFCSRALLGVLGAGVAAVLAAGALLLEAGALLLAAGAVEVTVTWGLQQAVAYKQLWSQQAATDARKHMAVR
jgi:hypothetical protein